MEFDVEKDSLVLETGRLRLRPLTVADVTDRYVAWLSDPNVNRYLETRHVPQPRDAIEAFVAARYGAPDTLLFGMYLKVDGRHVGNIKIGPVKNNHSLADMSLFIGEVDCWGKGYATEAIREVARYGLEALGLVKLAAVAYAVNLGSIHAFQKAGFKQEGHRRAHYLLDGAPADVVEFGMTRADLDETGSARP